MPHDSAKHYYFCRGRLYYTWKPKDNLVQLRDFLAKKKFSFVTGGVNFRLSLHGDLFQYIYLNHPVPCVPSQVRACSYDST